jgi:hypothetical protein
MQIRIKDNFPEVQRYLRELGPKVNTAAREGLNRTAEWAETNVRRSMRQVFDRPVPFTLRSLRVYYASGRKPEAMLWFRQRSQDADKLWARPQIDGGTRDLKPMELRLQRIGLMPKGWFIVPGDAAPLDAYGNMSPGEISRILNVLGSYTESGFNKANIKTRQRLRKGNQKKGVDGFEYWVNPAGAGREKHLLPGVYRRVYSGGRTSLKPMLIFVPRAQYRARLDFFGIVERTVAQRFPAEFDKALRSLIATGSASTFRKQEIKSAPGTQPPQRVLSAQAPTRAIGTTSKR